MKQKIWIPVVLLLGVMGFLLQLFVSSEWFTGVQFSEESTGHVGVYLEQGGILSSDSEAVSIDGTTATILKAGTYELSGRLTDGQIIVDADPTAEVVLKLCDVVLTCSDSAPIWVKCADKVKIKLPEDTSNLLEDGAFYSYAEPDAEVPNGCISAKSDLTIQGKGTLTVTAHYRNGISCSDDLRIKGGVLTVSAPRHALRGKNGVFITDGIHTLTAGKSAVESSECVLVEGGTLTLNAEEYLFHAVKDITVTDTPLITVTGRSNAIGCAGTQQLPDNLIETLS